MNNEIKLYRDKNHSHYWIDSSVLYESYNTIRGLRYRELVKLPLMSDSDHLNEEEIRAIETFLNNKQSEQRD